MPEVHHRREQAKRFLTEVVKDKTTPVGEVYDACEDLFQAVPKHSTERYEFYLGLEPTLFRNWPAEPSLYSRWNPAEYARNSDAQKRWAEELLSRLDLKGNETVLDLGCGDGKITAAFTQAAPRSRVVRIDSSPEMIRYAQAHHSALWLDTI